jgi:hypothetical protein
LSAEQEKQSTWYARIPRDVMSSQGLSLLAKLVYVVLEARAGKKRECWPSLKRIAVDVGRKRTSVHKALKELERSHLIEIVSRPGRSSLFRLNTEDLAQQPVQDSERVGIQDSERDPDGKPNGGGSGNRTQKPLKETHNTKPSIDGGDEGEKSTDISSADRWMKLAVGKLVALDYKSGSPTELVDEYGAESVLHAIEEAEQTANVKNPCGLVVSKLKSGHQAPEGWQPGRGDIYELDARLAKSKQDRRKYDSCEECGTRLVHGKPKQFPGLNGKTMNIRSMICPKCKPEDTSAEEDQHETSVQQTG